MVPALPNSTTSNPPSGSRGGESAPPKRGQGEAKASERGGRPPPDLRSLSPPRVWLISPAPPVAVIYLGVCARIVLGQPVGARKTATSKRRDYKPFSPPHPHSPDLFNILAVMGVHDSTHLSKLKEHIRDLIFQHVN